MPSSLAVGPLFKFLRIGRKLTVLSDGQIAVSAGAQFVLPAEALPAAADSVAGQVALDATHRVHVFNGTSWVLVGGQV